MSVETESITFDTPGAIQFFRMAVIASGAALYLKTGVKLNRAYTPTAMRDALNAASGSAAKNLRQALKDFVAAAEAAGSPVTNPSVLEAVA